MPPLARYVGANVPVQLICAAGHECAPRPATLQQGQGLCIRCARRGDKAGAEERFWQRVAELGGGPAAGAVYVDHGTPVGIICAEGHLCTPTPNSIRQGRGICITCAHRDPVQAEADFWERVIAGGARPAPGAVYVDAHTPVELICANGHLNAASPGYVRRAGRAGCLRCAGLSAEAAEERFWSLVADADATRTANSRYRNKYTPVELRCSRGHTTRTLPTTVFRGGSICVECNAGYDRLYLLDHLEAGAIKIGVASRDSRVATHLSRGYHFVAEWRPLSHAVAIGTEQAFLKEWRREGRPNVLGVPDDGHTETCPRHHLRETLAALVHTLGPPTRLEPQSLAS